MKNVIYILRTFNDIDHIVPLIDHNLKKGGKALILFKNNFNYKQDYRFKYLFSNYENLSIQKFYSVYLLNYLIDKIKWLKYTKILQIIRELILTFKLLFIAIDLSKNKYNAIVFEWSDVTKWNIDGRIMNYAKKYNVKTLCLPHGLTIFLNKKVNEGIKKIYLQNKKGPDFSNRNSFDKYFVQSTFHRKWSIEWGHDEKKIKATGSLRFYPEWQKINLKICPEFSIDKNAEGKLKTVLMLPHWSYNVYKSKCISLINKISNMDGVFLLIKDHTRGTGGLSKDLRFMFNQKENVLASISAHSPSLIQWSDVVINFGSSIGIEALLQNKILINPVFLHSNKTIFEKTKSCITIYNEKELMDSLFNIKNGVEQHIDDNGKDNLFREIIYGGRVPYDVIGYHWDQI
jgi:hypothetical protein|tara:strand:- start:605 stop:1810 length:1206 start_codon:yes stop_codon:yes gene_type:complete